MHNENLKLYYKLFLFIFSPHSCTVQFNIIKAFLFHQRMHYISVK